VALIALAATLLPAGSRGGALSEADRAAGKKLAASKCIACHKLYDPNNYEEAKWNEWMIKMKRKAKLNQEQFDKLTGYFAALRNDATQAVNAVP
jgi:mono/diheme cytochrome c family protein